MPKVENRMSKLPGPFISRISRDKNQPLSNQVQITRTCPANRQGSHNFHIRVKCPPMKCGLVKRNLNNPPKLRIRDETDRKKREEYLRIVGGDRSGPHNWPYIVALYKDGRFHCGGTILNEYWVRSSLFAMHFFWSVTIFIEAKRTLNNRICSSIDRSSPQRIALRRQPTIISKCTPVYFVALATHRKFK